MRGWVLDLAAHLRGALARADEIGWPPQGPAPGAVFLGGMGGSAMACHLARSVLWETAPVPIAVHQDPEVPFWVGEGVLAGLVSYSGNTWESLRMLGTCLDRGARLFGVASGGTLATSPSLSEGRCFPVPAGMAPRAALAWMWAPVTLAAAGGARSEVRRQLAAAAEELEAELDLWRGGRAVAGRDPWDLAERIAGRPVVVYAPGERSDPLALRWKNQLMENAEQMAFAGAFPELAHNEIMGWRSAVEESRPVFLILEDDEAGAVEDRRARRAVLEAALAELASYGADLVRVPASGRTTAARLFSHVALADLTSVELARRRGIDPLPIGAIERVKAACGKELFG